MQRLIAFVCLCVMTAVAGADVMDLEAIDSGFITAEGGASKFDGTITTASKNYSVGWELAADGGGMRFNIPFVYAEKKNYFVFDFAGVTGPITAATLKLELPETGYDSADPTETYVLSATSASPAELGMLGMIDILTEWYEPGAAPPPGLAGTPLSPPAPSGIPADNPFVIGSGIDVSTATGVDVKPDVIMLAKDMFGVLTEVYDGDASTALGAIDVGDPGATVTLDIDFTPFGVAYLNDMLPFGAAVLGGKLSSLSMATSGPPSPTEEIFGFTDFTLMAPTLSVTFIPEPSTIGLAGCGLVALMSRKRRVRRRR
ncbi:MAG: hypothetical protein CMJ18_04935 [Phycisphaeraceae bacterium]|nr:hypothetical protein [Phycisphaeraceae bacterium]